jgi:hypothetical protein
MKNCFYSFFCPFLTEVSSRPERSVVEGSAVPRTSVDRRGEIKPLPFQVLMQTL